MAGKYRHGMFWSAVLALPLMAGITACSDGANGNAQLTAIFFNPNTLTMDAGQTAALTASITNDGTPGGATFSVTGGGSLAGVTSVAGTTEKVSVNYTAPATAATAVVTGTSVHSPAQNASITITVNPALVITTTSLPTGSQIVKYDVTPAATGGTGTDTWSIASGTLPTGLTVAPATGEISGVPTVAGSFTFTLAVKDSAPTPMTAVQTFTVVISPPLPVVTAVTLPAGIIGTPYSQQLAYTGGGTGTATWAIASGSLPVSSGLTLSSAGLLSGTPLMSSTYTFSVMVTVGTQTSAPVALTLKTVPALLVTTTSLPSAHVNVAYSQQLAYTGGDGTTPAWKMVSGALPSTITLSSGGLLAGTPTVAGSYTIGVGVAVGTQTSPTVTLTLAVVSTQITSAVAASGEVGLPFAFQVTALGGTPPYAYSLATGSNALPGGLSINASTGLISGTPTTNTGSPFTGVVVQAKDSLGSAGTQSMTFTIAASRGSAANAELSGQYAFLLQGFDAAGNPVASAGSFTVDGGGHVTTGVMDTNGTALTSPASNVALIASTYALGADGRGQITLTSTSGSATYAIAVNTVVSGVAGGGAMTEFDATGRQFAGQFVKQTASAFTLASINSGFAFGVSGFSAATTRSGMIGELQFAGTAAVTSSELLTNTGTATAPVVPTAGALTIGTNGRGTLALVLPSSGGTLDFAVYVVSTTRLLLLSNDAVSSTRPLLAGDAVAQTIANGSFTAANLMGTGVFHEERLSTSGTTSVPDVQLGLYVFDGAGNLSGTEDRNVGGVASPLQLAGTYAVASNGRVTAYVGSVGLGGCLDCTKPISVFYMTGPGQAYTLDFSASGGSGSMLTQTTSSFTAASLSGAYSLGTDGLLTAAVVPESGLVTVSGSTLTGLLDQGVSEALVPDVALSATATVATNGRVALSNGAVVYLLSPTRGLWLDTTVAAPAIRELTHQ